MELMPGRICALELMPGRISAFKYEKLMPGRICALALMPGRILCIGIDARSNSVKNETVHVYKYNITFIDKYFIGKKPTRLYNEAEVHLRSANQPVILNYYNFEIFQYFLSFKSTFMTCPQTGRIQF